MGIDILIATNAVDIANSKPTVVIGEDVDLLIALIQFVNKKIQIYMFFHVTKIIKVNPKYGIYGLHMNI